MAAPPTTLPSQQRAPQPSRAIAPRAPGVVEQLQVRISELPAAEAGHETDLFEVAQTGVSRKLTMLLLKEAVAPDLRPFLTGLVGGVGITVVGLAPVPTVSLVATGEAGTYGDAQHIPQITTDQFGRVTGITLVPVPPPDLSGLAILNSPAFTGTPTAPTPTLGDSSTRLATAAFVQNTINARGFAPAHNPTFTGTATAPTLPEGDDANNIATTAFVARAILAGASISVGDTAPLNARSNSLWWHTVFGQLFLYFDDGDSVQWVPASPAVSNVEIPAGTIVDFAGAAAPQGWHLCDGALKNRTSDARLFAAIGTLYGDGDGSTTFALPNLRKRVTAMIDPATPGWEELGDEIGEATHTLNPSEMPSHGHAVDDPGHVHEMLTRADLASGGGLGAFAVATPLGQTTQVGSTGISIVPAGGGQPHNNVQPTTLLNKIIKR